MFEVSLEKQRIIMFIPYVNLFSLLIWLNNCYYWCYSVKTSLKGALYAFLHFLPVVTLQFIFIQLFPNLINIFGYLAMYLAPLAMSFGLIRFQEKLEW